MGQPKYSKSPHKIGARKANIELYRKLSGRQGIPVDREYWTLCNRQPPEPGAEIEQMLAAGVISSKSQFHGVDWDKKGEGIIAQNKVWHPEAHWYQGEWSEVITKVNFNPAFVYLDATNFADQHIASGLVTTTMMLCPFDTVLIVNLMLTDPRSSRVFDSDKLIRNLECRVPSMELSLWNIRIPNYRYSASKTELITYAFYKGDPK